MPGINIIWAPGEPSLLGYAVEQLLDLRFSDEAVTGQKLEHLFEQLLARSWREAARFHLNSHQKASPLSLVDRSQRNAWVNGTYTFDDLVRTEGLRLSESVGCDAVSRELAVAYSVGCSLRVHHGPSVRLRNDSQLIIQ